MGARAKLLLPKVQKKSKKSTEQAEKPARFYDDAESVVSISASNSADSLISYLKNVSKSVIANKNSPVKMEKFYERSEVMRLLQFIFLAEVCFIGFYLVWNIKERRPIRSTES